MTPAFWARRSRRERVVTAAGVAAMLVVCALTGTSATAQIGGGVLRAAGGDGCTPLELLLVPGTSEGTANPSTPTGLLAKVGQDLQTRFDSKLRVYTVPYPAVAFTDGKTYVQSKTEGVNDTRAELDRLANQCPDTKVAIAGYSQGADVAGDVACEIGGGSGAIPAANVVGVALVADPHRGTAGATNVGPATDKQGILGPRNCDSFAALSGRVASICVADDLYCAVDTTRDPVLAGIADVIGNSDTTGSSTTGNGASAKSTSAKSGSGDSKSTSDQMVSDFSHADLPGLATDVGQLADAARSGDSATVARLASKITDTLTPLADSVSAATDNPAISKTLKSAAEGSPEATTSSVLDTLQKMDLSKAVDTATSLATTALADTGGGSRSPATTTSAGTKSDTGSLTQQADSLTQQVAPLTSTSSDQLGTAVKILSTVEPQVWVDQILNVATGSLSLATNLPQILDKLGKIGPILLDGQTDIWAKVTQLHQIAGDLNTLFKPVVAMASKVDLTTAAKLIAMIPDPQGIAPVVAKVVEILAKVDVVSLANTVGDIQETAWKVLESCATGCNLLLATGLIPSGLKLAEIALQAFTGGGTKTSADQLGASSSTATGTTGTKSLTDTVSTLAGSNTGDALGQLIQQGLDAASFYTSGAHTSYADTVVDRSGRTTLVWITDWFTQQFNAALGVG